MWTNTPRVISGYKNASALIPQRHIGSKTKAISIFSFLHSLNLGSQRVTGYLEDFLHFWVSDAHGGTAAEPGFKPWFQILSWREGVKGDPQHLCSSSPLLSEPQPEWSICICYHKEKDPLLKLCSPKQNTEQCGREGPSAVSAVFCFFTWMAVDKMFALLKTNK